MALTGAQLSLLDSQLADVWDQWLIAAREGRATLASEMRAMYLALSERRRELTE